MYLPKHFEENRVDVLHHLIRHFPLGALVVMTADGLEANHIPFEVDPDPAPFGTLRAHIARGNPLCNVGARDALVIFQGPSGYISPSFYPSKRLTGKVVPTWNYAVVHAHGPLRLVEDAAWLRGLVGRLTLVQEAGRPEPWQVTDAPEDFLDRQMNAITGVEIPIARLLGKWKMSQNRPAQDRLGVEQALRGEGRESATALADMVRSSAPDPESG